MFRPLAAAILSVALALPATTAPARADAEDVAKVLGGLAALYVLKEALDRREERRAPAVTRNSGGQHHHQGHRHRHHDGSWHRHQGGRHDHSHGHRHHSGNAKRVPDRCARYLNTRRGEVLAYGARCMQRHVARPGSLPPQCIRRLNTDRGTRTVYGRGCLRREGWQVARR